MYRNGEDLYTKLLEFIYTSDRLVIFAPYIQSKILEDLTNESSHKIAAIVTTWKPKDLLLGSSDIEVFKTCSKRNIPLLLNNRLHAKIYLDYPKRSFLTSANISHRGLAFNIEKYNYELGVETTNSLEDIVYLDRILIDANEVTQEIYDTIKQYLKNLCIDNAPDEFDFTKEEDHFLLSALPMSQSIEHIYKAYSGDVNLTFEEKQSAFHDLRKYSISPRLTYKEFMQQLRGNFFSHAFIKKLLKYNGAGRRFGELRRWIQKNTTSVPVPRTIEINDPLNHIYNLVTELSEGRYQKIQPGKRTWVLQKVL